MRAFLAGLGVLVFLIVGCGRGSRHLSSRHLSTSRAKIGQTRSIVVDPGKPRVVFAVSALVASGLKSMDGGAHWHDVSPSGVVAFPAFGVSVAAVAFDPHNPQTIYVGGGDGCGVLKSTNGGASWRKDGLNGCGTYKKNGTGESITALAISPSGRVLYAGSEVLGSARGPGVYRSMNGGRSWRRVSDSPGGDIPILMLDPKNPRTLYTWTQGVFKSTDGGATWQTLHVPRAVDALAIDPHNPQNIYAGAGFSGAVLKSTNGGASWRIVGLKDDDVEALAISPRNPQIIFAGTLGGVFKSADGGRTWRSFALNGKDVWSLGIGASRRVLYAGTDDAVFALRFGR